MVVGRSITKSKDPIQSYQKLKSMGRCMRLKKEIAESLLEIRAVTLSPNEPFTWASGIQSPIYCDNRLTLSYPDIERKLPQELQKSLQRISRNRINCRDGNCRNSSCSMGE